MDKLIRVLLLTNGKVLISKIEEIAGADIGEPDCRLIDPVWYNDEVEEMTEGFKRFPGKRITPDTKLDISSDNILTLVAPDNKLLSEYLVFISD
jgi:hypothetical protein